MANKSISQLDAAVSASNDDLFETAIPDVGSASGYTSKKHTMAVIADHIASTVVYPALGTTAKTIVGALNELLISAGTGTKLTATLTAGNTSVTFTNQAILTTSMIDVYVDTWGVAPTNVVVSAGSATLTFEAQQSDVSVMLVIR